MFTLGAGVAVATMLPARLALWQIPRVAKARLAVPGSVLIPAGAQGPAPNRRRLAAALTAKAASSALGRHVGLVVTDLESGSVLFSRQAGSGFVPASSAKLLTAVAALGTLGPSARFTTRVVSGARGSVVLVGGGDPTLAAGQPPRPDYPQPATLRSLAGATARWLHAHGERRVRLGYDTSLFTGPLIAPGWTTSYITTGNVTPITSLEVDQGRLTPTGTPQDADDPDNFRPRSFTPATDAAAAFAGFLRRDGIRVTGRLRAGTGHGAQSVVATVRSPMLSSIVGWMLRESNNVIAEDLARQVALRTGRTRLVQRWRRRGHGGAGQARRRTGHPHGGRQRAVAAGPGLAAGAGRGGPAGGLDRPASAAGGHHRHARGRFLRHPGSRGRACSAASARRPSGMVRAKTGNLSKVASLAGITDDASGHLLAFAFMADRIQRASQLTAAARTIDEMATTLAGCGCR